MIRERKLGIASESYIQGNPVGPSIAIRSDRQRQTLDVQSKGLTFGVLVILLVITRRFFYSQEGFFIES